jgi:predicted lactoylglutathione lyase
LRAKSREAVDQTAALAASLGANIVRGPEERDWAPGYYYVLFEDPDGIRLEVNHVPGTGLLNTDASFGSADDYVRKDGKDLIDHR